MVEGGASVIGSFLAETQSNEGVSELRGIVDTIIVTVAPMLVGDDAVGYGIGLCGDQARVSSPNTNLI